MKDSFKILLLERRLLEPDMISEEDKKKYGARKFLAQGSNSLVYDSKKKGKVVIFTFDPSKFMWTTRAGIATLLGYVEPEISEEHWLYDELSELPVYVLEADKLRPLSEDNAERLYRLKDLYYKILAKLMDRYGENDYERKVIEILHEYLARKGFYKKLEKSFGKKFVDFLVNMERSTQLDFHEGNFMEDEKGNIIPIDPVVEKEIYDLVIYR